MKVTYPAKIDFDKTEHRYFVEFIDLPEAITEGETIDEALYNASEVLTLTIEGRLDEGGEVPKPSANQPGLFLITPSIRAQSALLIRWVKAEQELTTAAIARDLQTSWPAASRLENPRHWPSLRQLEKVAAALGQQLVISMEPRHHSE